MVDRVDHQQEAAITSNTNVKSYALTADTGKGLRMARTIRARSMDLKQIPSRYTAATKLRVHTDPVEEVTPIVLITGPNQISVTGPAMVTCVDSLLRGK
jgi:hypothetical protein